MAKLQCEEIDEFMNRLQTHKNVVGSILVNKEGLPITSTMEKAASNQYSSLMGELTENATNMIKSIDPYDITFISIHTKKQDIMIAPDGESGLRLVVVKSHSK